ncbi:unnamed protein product [Sphagnum tenellum]
MGVNAKTEVLELISMLKFHIRTCFDAAYGNICQLCVHLQMLVSSLSEIGWALLGWDAEKLIVILSHQMKSQCLAISDAYF